MKSPKEGYEIRYSVVSELGTREDLLNFLSFYTLDIFHVTVLRIRIRWIRNKSTSKTYSFLKELFVMKEIQKELDEREKDGDEEEEKDEDGVRRLEDGVKERLREDVEADRGKLRREVTSTLNFTEVQTLISLINRLFPGVHRQNIS